MRGKIDIIDAHVHVGIPSHRNKKTETLPFDLYNDYESFLKCMDKTSVSRAVILPIPHRDFNSKRSNEYLLEACLASSNRLIPFCRIDGKLENNLCNGFKGAKLHLVYEDIEISKIKHELQVLEYYNAPLLLHAKFKGKVQQVEQILKYAPNLHLILAHMGRGHINTREGIIENAQSLKKYDRVYFETSTVEDPRTGDVSFIKDVCSIIGNNRVIFGTDYPFQKDLYNYHSRIDMLVKSNLDKHILKNIMYNNIFELLNLGNDENHLVIRKAKKNDISALNLFWNDLSDEDRKFLAFVPKASHIKTEIRNERHCYIGLIRNTIVAFMRESGRPNDYSLLEELVVHPKYRRMGIAQNMLKYYHRIFPKTLAKTNAKNTGMMKLLKRNNYQAENPESPRIINWIRNNE